MNGFIAAVGTFDGVHRGHRFLVEQLIREAGIRGLQPMVVTFGRHPLEVVAPDRVPPQLTMPAERRALLLEAGAERVVELDFDDDMRRMSTFDFLQMLRRDYDVKALLLGFNNRIGHNPPSTLDGYRAVGREAGVDIVMAAELPGPRVSSSVVRRQIASGMMAEAAAALGRNYSLRGTVGAGRQLGRKIGFPTANLIPADAGLLVPEPGVYAAFVRIQGGDEYQAMVNIGHRPTVDAPEAPLTIEVHLIGFDGDIYGRELEIGFVGRMRPERKFPSVEALKSQLVKDLDVARLMLDSKNN